MADFIIPNHLDSEQKLTIPLFPELSSTTPGNPNMTTSQALILGSLAASYILTGSPALETFHTPNLITTLRRLWEWHMLIYAAEQEGMSSEDITTALVTLLEN